MLLARTRIKRHQTSFKVYDWSFLVRDRNLPVLYLRAHELAFARPSPISLIPTQDLSNHVPHEATRHWVHACDQKTYQVYHMFFASDVDATGMCMHFRTRIITWCGFRSGWTGPCSARPGTPAEGARSWPKMLNTRGVSSLNDFLKNTNNTRILFST